MGPLQPDCSVSARGPPPAGLASLSSVHAGWVSLTWALLRMSSGPQQLSRGLNPELALASV